MTRFPSLLLAVLAVLACTPPVRRPLRAQSAPDSRPTLAVMHFTNGALIGGSDYAPLSKGIAELLATDLAANPSIRVVERDRLQEILAEQQLQSQTEVDKATAARLGKILGAQHFLTGGFVIDPKQRLRLDIRSINVETGQVEYVETVQGKAGEILDLVAKLSEKVTHGLSLPAAKRADDVKRDAKDPLRAATQLGRALAAKDRGDTTAAIAAAQEALISFPDFPSARALLAQLQKTP